MSMTAAGWAEQQPVSGRKKQLLLVIARTVDETGSCRSVTQDDLAASCDCSVRQVRRLIKQLAGDKYLAHRARGASGGGRTSDLYALPREARERGDTKPDTVMTALVENASKPDI
jgi:predicted ArsR family transcriptional regulator